MISAIITTYNRERYLARAIASVINQSYRDLELIVLDNGSTDQTPKLMKALMNADPGIRYIRHDPMSIGKARNLGVKLAWGEYVAFLDDDDEWEPNKLAWQVGVLDYSSAALVYGGFWRIDKHGRELLFHAPVLRGKILTHLLWAREDFTGSASNALIRKSAIEAVGGFRDDFATSEDWDLYLRLAEKYEIELLPYPVVRIRTHQGARLGDKLAEARKVEADVLHRYWDRMSWPLRLWYLAKIGRKGYRLRFASMRESVRRRWQVANLQTVFAAGELRHRISPEPKFEDHHNHMILRDRGPR